MKRNSVDSRKNGINKSFNYNLLIEISGRDKSIELSILIPIAA
jgi:hypothetical protein